MCIRITVLLIKTLTLFPHHHHDPLSTTLTRSQHVPDHRLTSFQCFIGEQSLRFSEEILFGAQFTSTRSVNESQEKWMWSECFRVDSNENRLIAQSTV